MDGAKKHYSGSDVSECVKEREETNGRMGRGIVFLDVVGWMGFVGSTKNKPQQTYRKQ